MKDGEKETPTRNLTTTLGRSTDFSPMAWAVNVLFPVKRLVRYENVRVQAKAGKHKASNKSGSCLSCSLSGEQVSVAP